MGRNLSMLWHFFGGASPTLQAGRLIMKGRCEWCHGVDGLKEIMVEGTNPFSCDKGELSFFVCLEHEEKLRGF